MSHSIYNPRRIEIGSEEIKRIIEEAIIQKYPELKDEEFEVTYLLNNSYQKIELFIELL